MLVSIITGTGFLCISKNVRLQGVYERYEIKCKKGFKFTQQKKKMKFVENAMFLISIP
jgi:hypothetical protein